MATKRPPLHLLHIFEAAARLQSFKQAGEELHITPSAVSHQIKALEGFLELKLFERIPRGVRLTDSGSIYAHSVKDLFQGLDKATAQLIQDHQKPRLRVNMMSSMANNHVLPNLHKFSEQYPNIYVEIESDDNSINFDEEDCDIAIRFGKGSWPGLKVELLTTTQALLVCSPDFLKKYQCHKPQNLQFLPLINIKGFSDMWQRWSHGLGIQEFNGNKMIVYKSYSNSMVAAQQGLGVGTAIYELEHPLIKKELLIPLFDKMMPVDMSIYAVYPNKSSLSEPGQQFISWLKSLLISP